MAIKTTFTLAANIAGDIESGILVGEFNNWDEDNGIPLKKQKDGSFKAEVALEPGTYHYRYFLSDGRWVNDGNAHHYAPVHGLHVDNCVIIISETTPKAKKTAPKAEETSTEPTPSKTKKSAPKKEESAKADTKVKAAPKEKAEPKTKTISKAKK